jgi:hypothetical protein
MKFFFPLTPADEQEAVYRGAKGRVEIGRGPMRSARVWSITYEYRGKRYVASVGETDHLTGKTVLAIFQSARDPLLFWPLVGDSHGCQLGGVVRADSDSLVTYFQRLPAEAEGLAGGHPTALIEGRASGTRRGLSLLGILRKLNSSLPRSFPASLLFTPGGRFLRARLPCRPLGTKWFFSPRSFRPVRLR